MSFTEGEWKAEEIAPGEWAVMKSLTMICYHNKARDIAELIATTVNSCQAIKGH